MRKTRETAMLLLVLGTLHLGLLQDPSSALGKAVLLVHFGVVLLWQPLVNPQRHLPLSALVAIVAWVGLAGALLSWGVLLLWCLLLGGVIGGRIFMHARPRARIPYWLALVAVIVGELGRVMPQLLHEIGKFNMALVAPTTWMVLPLYALILIFPVQDDPSEEASALDLVGSLLIVLVLTGVVLGVFVLMFLRQIEYQYAILAALGVVATCLLMLAWLWGPHGGFAGLGLEVTRRMLSGGALNMPFDRWLERITDLALHETSPEQFLQSATSGLLQWPGIVGLNWHRQVGGSEAAHAETHAFLHCGQESKFCSEVELRGLRVAIYVQRPLANTALWQLNLMLRVLVEIYASKIQARQLQADSYLRAVHETGARVTHEIKNLLQSLHGLCFAVMSMQGGADSEAQSMLARQLPMIVERLEQASARIRKPSEESMRMEPAKLWWRRQQERLAGQAIVWQVPDFDAQTQTLPAALFDNVFDNLLQNALAKQKLAKSLSTENEATTIAVSLLAEPSGWGLQVEDRGLAIPEKIAETLFLAPQPSDSGLGIGLYQASRLAESTGYRLALADNRDHCVRFKLSTAW